MLAVVLGLASSVLWGLGDFAGGVAARRSPVAAVLLVSQAAGWAGLVVLVAARGQAPPSFGQLWPAAAAGAGGAVALGAFYHGLAIGTMSIVAPISATGAAIPVAVGLAGGDRPSGLQLVGVAVAVLGVVLASREVDESGRRPERARRSVALALVAALGFGGFFVGMDRAANSDVFWALLTGRSASVAMAALGAVALRLAVVVPPRRLPALAMVGALDVSANALYAWGSTEGLLSLVAVLGSLYPVVTVLLARVVLAERVRPIQDVGIVAALLGVVLIAGG